MKIKLTYWKITLEEAKEFVTYGFNEHQMGFDTIGEFFKKQFPEYCNVPSENPETIQKAKEYFKRSNMEDLMVLEKEKEAFEKFYRETKKDILRHIE